MKRLLVSPISVAEAYCHIDFTPGKTWIDGENKRCCGLTAYLIHNKLVTMQDFLSESTTDMVAEKLGWTGLDVASFAAGFDGIPLPEKGHYAFGCYDLFFYRRGVAAAELTRAVHGEIKERD